MKRERRTSPLPGGRVRRLWSNSGRGHTPTHTPRSPTSWGAGWASPNRPGLGSGGSAPCSTRLLLRGVPGCRPMGGGRHGAGSRALGAQPSQARGPTVPGPRPGDCAGFPRGPHEPSGWPEYSVRQIAHPKMQDGCATARQPLQPHHGLHLPAPAQPAPRHPARPGNSVPPATTILGLGRGMLPGSAQPSPQVRGLLFELVAFYV